MATVRPLPWATLTIPAARAINNVGSSADARQLSVAGARTVVRLTYGQDRIGGDILNVLPVTTGSTEILVQVLWGFAGSALSDVRLNGQALPGAATVTTYLGAQTTADTALVAAFLAQSITYTDTLEGFAYSVIRLPQSAVGSELQITGLYSGRRLYDPRKDSTAGGTGSHRLATPSTYEYSDNPALALGNFLHNTVYGASETVDWASVATTASANDALVGTPSEKRRLIGVTFTSAGSVADTAETLRAYAGCFLLPSASGVKLLPDADDASSATYAHADGSIASISPLQLRDLGNSPTTVEVIYTDTTVIPWRDGSAFADLPGSGTTLPYRLSQVLLPGVKRYSQARREAIERLNKLTLQNLSTTIEVFDIGIRHQRGDIIRLTHPIGVTNKLFRITDIEAAQPGRWMLTLIEHDPACYSDVVETVPTYANSGALISESAGGGSGISTYMIEIYRQSATQPVTPQAGQYTFVDDVFVPPDGWSRSQPTGNTMPTWASRYLVQTTTPSVQVDIPTGVCELGPTWMASTVISRDHSSVTYGAGKFVIGDRSAGDSVWQWSSDGGSTWTNATSSIASSGGPNRIAFGGGVFFAHLNAILCATSADGDVWQPFPHASVSSIAEPVFAFGKFYVFGQTTYYTGNLSGGISSGSVPAYSAIYGGAFGNQRIVTLGNDGATRYASYSTDGVNFIPAATPPSTVCARVAFGAGRFVASPNIASASSTYWHTVDGITWTAGTLPASRIWVDVVFAQNAFLMICTGPNGADIARSEDGLTWELVEASKRFTASAGFNRIAASDDGQYVAINTGTTSAINKGSCIAEAAWSIPNKHVQDGASGQNSILATVSEFEASPVASRTRPVGIYAPRYHTLVEAAYTNTSTAIQYIDISIDGGAVKTSGTGSVYLTAEFGLSSVNGVDTDGDRIAYMEDVTTTPRRRASVGSLTLAAGATVYASVAVVIDVTTGTVQCTGRNCQVSIVAMTV